MISCSVASSVNQVNIVEMKFQGSLKDGSDNGVVHIFKRASWYQEITMVMDAMVHEVVADDPLIELMDEEEKKQMSTCSKFYVILLYSQIGGRLKNSDFWTQFAGPDIKKVMLGKLKKHLLMGSQFYQQSLMQYEYAGACLLKNTEVIVQVPGFRKVTELF
jgi:hypothetical protein